MPGEVYELRIDLGPVGAHVPAGSRLRLDISSSDFPQWDRNLNTGGTPLAGQRPGGRAGHPDRPAQRRALRPGSPCPSADW